jgi:hypothetical protein
MLFEHSASLGRSGRGARLVAGFFMVLAMLALPRTAHADSMDLGNKPYQWDYLFPLFGNKLASKGIKFPLPFGIGINYAAINQDITIKNIQLAVNDSEYVDLSKIVTFDRVRSSVKGLNTRLDLWLFPFLNVYALGIWGIDADTDVSLATPFKLNAGASQSSYGGGFGTTAAFGAFGIFGTLDLNVSWNKVEALNRSVFGFLMTPRFGKRFKIGKNVWWTGWVGAMRQYIAAGTDGSIKLDDVIGEPSDSFKGKVKSWYDSLGRGEQAIVGGVYDRLQNTPSPVIHYRLDKEIKDPWNMLLGMEADLNQRVQFRTEVGFLGRTQLILGINYRFELIKR